MSISEISRRRLLQSTVILAGATMLPRSGFAQDAMQGGRLVVAADSEPRSLNPAIVASNGVFYIASKIIEPLAELRAEESATESLSSDSRQAADAT